MTLLCLASVNGAPGVSSWGLLLAAALPVTGRRVLLEADVSGGVLAARYGLSEEPGTTSLVSNSRLDPGSPAELEHHGRRLEEMVWCVPGPSSPEAAWSVWSGGASETAKVLAEDGDLWVADIGRIGRQTPCWPLLEAADLIVVFAEAKRESLAALPPVLARFGDLGHLGVVLVGRTSAPKLELVDYLHCPNLWMVESEPDLAKLAGQLFLSNRARRSKAWRDGLDVASDLAALLAHRRTVPPLPPPSAFFVPAESRRMEDHHG